MNVVSLSSEYAEPTSKGFKRCRRDQEMNMTKSAITSLRDDDLRLASGGATTEDQLLWEAYLRGGAMPPRKGDTYGTIATINFPERRAPPPPPKKGGKK